MNWVHPSPLPAKLQPPLALRISCWTATLVLMLAVVIITGLRGGVFGALETLVLWFIGVPIFRALALASYAWVKQRRIH